MKTRKQTGQIAALVALVLLMMSVLTSCAGTPDTFVKLEIENDVYLNMKYDQNKDLKPSEVKTIANVIVEAYNKKGDFDFHQALVASGRGYNMLEEGFDPNSDACFEAKPADLAAAKAVILKANEVAGSMSTEELEGYLKKFTEKDLSAMIDSIKKHADLEPNNWWDSLLIGIGTVLNWFTFIGAGNYVLGICIFAIAVEILMFPLAIKQQKNSIKQAKLRPKEMAIRNKYKGRNDQPTMQKMQAEIQELYQRENFSPASGCLPLLVQLPIIMLLWNIVSNPLRYVLGQSQSVIRALEAFVNTSKAAGGMGQNITVSNGSIELLSKINVDAAFTERLENFQLYQFGPGALDALKEDLATPLNFGIGPVNFGMTPMGNNFSDWTAWILLLVPVLTFATYFVTAKLNRKFMYQPVANEGMDARQMACSNSMMDITMPAMSAFFTLAVPAVIGVYWAFRSWLGFAKTVIMSKAMPIPTFTEEDYKAAAKEMAGKKAPVKKSANAGKVRSLHYIDDEDFEDTRERGLARRAALEEQEKLEQEKKAGKTPFAAAPLKDDKKSENTDENKTETPINDSLINDAAEPEAQEKDDNQ